MFRFQKLEVVHWDFWERFSLPLDADVITIVGPNGSGKTTLLDALRTLLCIDCSSGRDYKRYLRRNERPFAWLRAVVDNQRQDSGYRPFFPLLSETVTLACQIRKKGGDWQRQYVIAEGDTPIEALEEQGSWLGVRDYRQRLQNAGLTQAIRHVLALEQGDTDKLCEYSPRQLLELVFSVFGDQEVLENYQQAKNEQLEIARELEKLEEELTRLGARQREAEGNVNSFRQWKRFNDELLRLGSETLPRCQLADLRERIRTGEAQMRSRRQEVNERQRRHWQLLEESRQLNKVREEAAAAEKEARQAEQEAEKAFIDGRDKARDAEKVLEQKARLEELCRQQEAGVDLAALAAEQREKLGRRAENDRELEQVKKTARDLKAQLAALKAGEKPEPGFVREFRRALGEAGVRHNLLTEIVEVADPGWQAAVEGVLAPSAHIVLLERPGDRQKAWELGEKLRYKHFVVAERQALPQAAKGSLLEVVKFTADPPGWLAELLNRIQRVESVAEGSASGGDSWITRQGYHRERRGGRYIGVEGRYQFGEAARRSMLEESEQELGRLAEREQQLQADSAGLSRRLEEISALLSGMDAARQLAERGAEFARAEEQFAALSAQAQEAGVALAEAKGKAAQAVEARHQLEKKQSGNAGEIRVLERDLEKLSGEFRQLRRQQVERILQYREKRRPMPQRWYSREAMEELRLEYDSAEAVRREMKRLQDHLDEGEWVTDEQVVVILEKLKGDYAQMDEIIRARRIHHHRHLQATEEARESYINVLKATVRRYSRNVRDLGELAGIGVELEPPHLVNEDVALAQAGLQVSFNFDQKGLIGLNDGEASGGQQVMKSLILLIGLLMDEARSGGFVFIDEPFAHLDVFNIDKVGAFLEATRSQYVLTTPNTHNVNVFKTSDLTLVTQKIRRPEKWAPPVAFVRRERRAENAA
ncbi:hypothetical protein DESUT3_06320 [Desulfuromonas versatilis]|uniref:RecF/RecN/SMC N-terminal domain-containing protein n=1 Tax=Desulfuromonas versatilis TaxID=2802975 RepID=A0ABN6DTV7_9BACT|nr:ATP-binding protein [Desulfuromonas versatilis]BCR03563.1 hypothetical protein DESUT3_06320 [Desulfuromonas versatilis]